MSTDASSLISIWNQNADAKAKAPVEPNRVLSLATLCVLIAFIPFFLLVLFLVYLAKRARQQLGKKRSTINPETISSLIDTTDGTGHVPSTARLFVSSSMRSDMPVITEPPSDRRIITSGDLSPCGSNIPCDKQGVFTHYSSNNKDIIRLCLESKTPYRHVKFAFQFNDQQIHSLFDQQTEFSPGKDGTKPDSDPDANEKPKYVEKAVGEDPPVEPEEPYVEGQMEQKRETSDPEEENFAGYSYLSELPESSTTAHTVPVPVVDEPYDEGQMEQLRRTSDPEKQDVLLITANSEARESVMKKPSTPPEPVNDGQMEQVRRPSDYAEGQMEQLRRLSQPEEQSSEMFSAETGGSSGTTEVPEPVPELEEEDSDWNTQESMLLDTAFMAIPIIFKKLRSVFTQTDKRPTPVVANKATSNDPKENEGTSTHDRIDETGTATELTKTKEEHVGVALLNSDASVEAQLRSDDVGAGTHEMKNAAGTETNTAYTADVGETGNQFSVQAMAGTEQPLESRGSGSHLEESHVASETAGSKHASESTEASSSSSPNHDKSTSTGLTDSKSTSTIKIIISPQVGSDGKKLSEEEKRLSGNKTQLLNDRKDVPGDPTNSSNDRKEPLDNQTELSNDQLRLPNSQNIIPGDQTNLPTDPTKLPNNQSELPGGHTHISEAQPSVFSSRYDQIERPSQASSYPDNKLSVMPDGFFPPPATAAESEVVIRTMPTAADSVLMLIRSHSVSGSQDMDRSVEIRMPQSSGMHKTLSREMRTVVDEDESSANAQTGTQEKRRSSLHPEELKSLVSRIKDFEEKENVFHDKNSEVIAHLAIDQAQRAASMGPDTMDFSESVILSSDQHASTSNTMDSLGQRAQGLTENDDSTIERTSEAIAEEAIDNAVNQMSTSSTVGTSGVTNNPPDCDCPTKKGSSKTGLRKKQVKKDKSVIKTGHFENSKSKKPKKK